MCPGGTVVAATSEPGRVVTNGMSQYSRNERNANAGIVVGITPADIRAACWRAWNSSGAGRVRPLWRVAEPIPRQASWWAIFSPGGRQKIW